MNLGDYFGQSIGNVTAVTGSVNSTVLLYPDDNRIKVLFYNHSSNALYLKYGDGATTASYNFSVLLGSGSYYETLLPVHTGSFTGMWDGAGGSVLITTFSRV